MCLSAGYYDAYYLKAQKVRSLIARDFSKALSSKWMRSSRRCRRFRHSRSARKVDDPMSMYLSDIYTITGDLSGVPCMSVPCGKSPDGLPVGLQILDQAFR